jgi:hypothetical protein
MAREYNKISIFLLLQNWLQEVKKHHFNHASHEPPSARCGAGEIYNPYPHLAKHLYDIETMHPILEFLFKHA